MKKYLYSMCKTVIFSIVECRLFRRKASNPSLLALNIDWFTNCTWVDQLISFQQIDRYRTGY